MLVRRPPRPSRVAPSPASSSTDRGPQAPLTAREHEVVRHVVGGGTNPQIAATMHLSDRTVQSHVAEACRKLGARNRTHLAVLAIRHGVVDLPDAGR